MKRKSEDKIDKEGSTKSARLQQFTDNSTAETDGNQVMFKTASGKELAVSSSAMEQAKLLFESVKKIVEDEQLAGGGKSEVGPIAGPSKASVVIGSTPPTLSDGQKIIPASPPSLSVNSGLTQEFRDGIKALLDDKDYTDF